MVFYARVLEKTWLSKTESSGILFLVLGTYMALSISLLFSSVPLKYNHMAIVTSHNSTGTTV